MTANTETGRTRGVTLRSPEDALRVVRRLVNECFRQGLEIEMMGRLTNALNTWLKARELERSARLEARISKLEAQLERRS